MSFRVANSRHVGCQQILKALLRVNTGREGTFGHPLAPARTARQLV